MATVAIVDYGLGNLFSVAQACRHAGLEARITGDAEAMRAADAILLPGVGAFGDAMAALGERGLDRTLVDLARAGKPLIGICLGLQLLMSESREFGDHPGLGLIEGTVERLPDATDAAGRRIKVPQVGWAPVRPAPGAEWAGTPLAGVPQAAYMYFVHSYRVVPRDPAVVLAETPFGGDAFCSAVAAGAVFGCQFHPERSASLGLGIYRNIARRIEETAPR